MHGNVIKKKKNEEIIGSKNCLGMTGTLIL